MRRPGLQPARIVLRTALIAAALVLAAPAASTPTWLPPTTLGSGWDPYYVRPGLGVSRAGDAAVVTWGSLSSGEKIWASVRPAGGQWSAPEAISGQVDRDGPIYPAAAWDDAGNLTAVWWENGVVFAADRPFGGTWQAPVRLSALTGGAA